MFDGHQGIQNREVTTVLQKGLLVKELIQNKVIGKWSLINNKWNLMFN